ncbi:hypothetical protein RQP46_005000 [Phenoliferia psychrophenolica]
MSYGRPRASDGRGEGGRASQPPVGGPSLASPSVPASLRPSRFHPRASFLAQSHPYAPFPSASPFAFSPSTATPPAAAHAGHRAPHPTPLSAFRRRTSNPFDVLSAPQFDSFVDGLTSSIRSALAGPPKPERRPAVEQRASPAPTQLDELELERERDASEDVFGEVKALLNGQAHTNGTNGFSEHEQDEDEDEEMAELPLADASEPESENDDDEQSGFDSDELLPTATEATGRDQLPAPPLVAPHSSTYEDDSSDERSSLEFVEEEQDEEQDEPSDREFELEDDDEAPAVISYADQIASYGWNAPDDAQQNSRDHSTSPSQSPAPAPAPAPALVARPSQPANIETIELGSDSSGDDEDASGEDAPMYELEGQEEGQEEEDEWYGENPPSRDDDAEDDEPSFLGSRIPWDQKGKGRAPTPLSSDSEELDTDRSDDESESDTESNQSLDAEHLLTLPTGRLALLLESLDNHRARALDAGIVEQALFFDRQHELVDAVLTAAMQDEEEEEGLDRDSRDGLEEEPAAESERHSREPTPTEDETAADRKVRLDAEARLGEIATQLVAMDAMPGPRQPLEIGNGSLAAYEDDHEEAMVAAPTPPADISQPPTFATAEDFVPFDDSDVGEESLPDDDEASQHDAGPALARASASPEFEESEVVVLDSSDESGEQEQEQDQDREEDRERRESSEPLAFSESSADEEAREASPFNAKSESPEPSGARIRNVIAPGYWDPSTPIRFGPPSLAPTTPSLPFAQPSFALPPDTTIPAYVEPEIQVPVAGDEEEEPLSVEIVEQLSTVAPKFAPSVDMEGAVLAAESLLSPTVDPFAPEEIAIEEPQPLTPLEQELMGIAVVESESVESELAEPELAGPELATVDERGQQDEAMDEDEAMLAYTHNESPEIDELASTAPSPQADIAVDAPESEASDSSGADTPLLVQSAFPSDPVALQEEGHDYPSHADATSSELYDQLAALLPGDAMVPLNDVSNPPSPPFSGAEESRAASHPIGDAETSLNEALSPASPRELPETDVPGDLENEGSVEVMSPPPVTDEPSPQTVESPTTPSNSTSIESNAPESPAASQNDDAASLASDDHSVAGSDVAGGGSRKRGRPSTAAPVDADPSHLAVEMPSPNKRRRGGRTSKTKDEVVDEPASDPPAVQPRLNHQHSHRRSPAPAQPAAPDVTVERSQDEVAATHIPITRSNCQFVGIELRSKESPTSDPYTIIVPECALSAPLAQETMQDFSGRTLGPLKVDESEVVRLGGSGLAEGDADDDDALIEDGDVRVAIKRIVGTDLWAEGVAELVRRRPSVGDEQPKAPTPQRKGRK